MCFTFLCFYPNVTALRLGICSRKSVCLSSVTFVQHPTQLVGIFGNVSTLFCTLAIRWLPRKILRRSSQENSSVGVKRKKVSQIWARKVAFRTQVNINRADNKQTKPCRVHGLRSTMPPFHFLHLYNVVVNFKKCHVRVSQLLKSYLSLMLPLCDDAYSTSGYTDGWISTNMTVGDNRKRHQTTYSSLKWAITIVLSILLSMITQQSLIKRCFILHISDLLVALHTNL